MDKVELILLFILSFSLIKCDMLVSCSSDAACSTGCCLDNLCRDISYCDKFNLYRQLYIALFCILGVFVVAIIALIILICIKNNELLNLRRRLGIERKAKVFPGGLDNSYSSSSMVKMDGKPDGKMKGKKIID